MPYIKQEYREELDIEINKIIRAIDLLDLDTPDGAINYVFTKVLISYFNTGYVNIERAIGLLECCKLEYYRRLASEYEDKKSIENGDVYRDKSTAPIVIHNSTSFH